MSEIGSLFPFHSTRSAFNRLPSMMKLPLRLFLTTSAVAAPLAAVGYVAPPALLRSPAARYPVASRLHYKEPAGPASDASRAWSVLADTERWIRDTLVRSNRAANARLDEAERRREERPLHFADEKGRGEPLPRADNPYARKEVTYACETGGGTAAVAGGVFRRVREARELGEAHGRGAAARRGDASRPARATLRQTNLVVIPNCADLDDFATFDRLIRAINQARRAARDYVLKPRGEEEGDGADWVVSINCAHLHPDYGTPGPAEQLAALRREEAEGEVDVNLQEYKKHRDAARRSPYPSLIVEIKSTPPPDFGAREEKEGAAAALEAAARDAMEVRGKEATSMDVQKLEALFGRSAAKKSAEDPFYDALGEAFGNKQIAPRTPLRMAQDWVLRNDPSFDDQTSTFTTSDTRHVDAAHEYVLHSMAMLAHDANTRRGRRSYVVLPNFVPASATSLDRFAGQVSNIASAVPGLAGRVAVLTFHPEHVAETTRAPVPIVVITWK